MGGAATGPAGEAILEGIRRLLTAAGVPWEEIAHPPVSTAEEAAEARGTPLEIGAKSIVMKTDDDFRLLVLSAAAALRSRHLRRHLGVRRTRFATPEELSDLTGLEPGMVPPFGEPVLPLRLHADPGLLENERIAFTPGVADRSIVMASGDWERVARPEVFRFRR